MLCSTLYSFPLPNSWPEFPENNHNRDTSISTNFNPYKNKRIRRVEMVSSHAGCNFSLDEFVKVACFEATEQSQTRYGLCASEAVPCILLLQHALWHGLIEIQISRLL